MSEWREIETAPHDGTNILVSHKGADWVFVARWFKGYWKANSVYCKPTHWMPLPEPPK